MWIVERVEREGGGNRGRYTHQAPREQGRNDRLIRFRKVCDYSKVGKFEKRE